MVSDIEKTSLLPKSECGTGESKTSLINQAIMADNETTSLLPKSKSETGEREMDTSATPRFYIIGIILSIYYFTLGVSAYTVSEWIQFYVKHEVFGNQSTATAEKGCESTNHSDPSYIEFTTVQETTARWQIYRNLGTCVPVLFVIPFLPSYSDRVGRRFLFIFGLSSSFVKYMVLAIVVKFNFGLIWIVAAHTLDAFSGSYYTIMSGASSFIADVTKRNNGKRLVWLTILDSVMLLNTTLSGIATGYLIKSTGYFIPTLGCACALLLATLLTITCLPESLDENDRSSKTTLSGYVGRTFDFYRSKEFKGKRAAYILLIVTHFFETMTITNRTGLETLYQLGMPFCWTAEKIGLFSAVRHAAQGLVGPMLLLPLKRCISDLKIGIFGALANGVSFVLEGLASNSLVLYSACVPVIFSHLTVSVVKNFMSAMTPVDKQGSLFAGIMCVECLCMIVTNFVSSMIYAATITFMHGFTFLVLAMECSVVVVLLVVYGVSQKPGLLNHVQATNS